MYFITWCSQAALWLFLVPFHERMVRVLSSLLICRPRTNYFLYFHRIFHRLVHFTYFFTGCLPALWLFHIPFHKIIPFVETYVFYIFTGYFTGKFISHFLSSVLSVTHKLSFSYVSHYLFHILYMWNTVWKGGARFTWFSQVFHTAFSQLFSHTREKSCEILSENYVKYLWKLCICSHGFHMPFTCFFTG